MEHYRQEFQPPARLLLGAGPSNVNPRVLQAMSMSLVGHLDPNFLQVMDDVADMLRLVFRTNNDLTLPISGTGSAGMEAALVSVLEHGDSIVVGINGFFGERIAQIAERCGATVHRVEATWGHPLDPEAIEAELKRHNGVKAVAFVHAETSAGVLTPPQPIVDIAHHHGALALVDTVTSLGGVEVDVDGWEADICFSGSQKCLGCPPGLAPVTVSPRAETVMQDRQTLVQSWYLDMTLLRRYWSGTRMYHHTAPISMLYGLREGLRVVLEEGLSTRIQRHTQVSTALKAGLEALGLRLFAQEGYRLPNLTTVRIPDGVDDAAVRSALMERYGIEIGGGLGPVAGQVWRIGLMGENATASSVLTILSALEDLLPENGYEIGRGEGVATAQRALAE